MLTGSRQIFQLALEGKARRYALSNIFILGICFGLSNLLGAIQTTPDLPLEGKFALITPLIFSIAGVVTMCAALIAFTLVYWAAARALGGYGGFGLIFDLIGTAAIPFWVLAPFLNYSIRYQVDGALRPIITFIVIASFLWSFKTIRESMIVGQGMGAAKATFAVAAMWIFSTSAIYVFIP